MVRLCFGIARALVALTGDDAPHAQHRRRAYRGKGLCWSCWSRNSDSNRTGYSHMRGRRFGIAGTPKMCVPQLCHQATRLIILD